MAASDNTPGTPNIPATLAVTTFIGTCKPKLLPKAFKKNRSMPPITTLANILPKNFNGFEGVPISNNITIKMIIIETTINGSIIKTPLGYSS